MRPQLVGAGPLFPLVEADLGLSHAAVGLLATIPVLCMGLFAPLAAWLMLRLGTRAAVALCLGLIASFGLARALAAEPVLLVALTIPVGVGMGFAGALMPIAVKERFADRPGFATGVYATGINAGAALSAVAAVPLAHAAGGWRASLLAFSAITGLLVVAWLVLTDGEPRARPSAAPLLRPPLASGVGWWLVAIFASMSVMFYGLNAWLADSYVERGWDAAAAGALVGVINVLSVVPAILVPWLSDRLGSRRPYLVGAGVTVLAALLGFVVLPAGGYAWAVLAGLGIGVMFPLVLTLPLDAAERPDQAGALAGMMLGLGYSLSALAPILLGSVRDATGSFTATLWLIVGFGAAFLVAVLPLARERLHEHAAAQSSSEQEPDRAASGSTARAGARSCRGERRRPR